MRPRVLRGVRPMRAVADTNVVVSGLFGHGVPRRILDLAHAGSVDLYTSAVLLAELEDVLGRPLFAQHLESLGLTPSSLVLNYSALATLVSPATISAVITDDPDDDAVLACALAARADAIVSGDKHLLSLGRFQGIPVVSALGLLNMLTKSLS